MTTTPPPATAYRQGQAVHVRGTIDAVDPADPDYTYRVQLPDKLALWFPASALAAPPAAPPVGAAGTGGLIRLGGGEEAFFDVSTGIYYRKETDERDRPIVRVDGPAGGYSVRQPAAGALLLHLGQLSEGRR